MNKFLRGIILFISGGLAYGGLELCWRGHTHWSMILAGGICFLTMFVIYTSYPDMNIVNRALIGTAVITSVEFIFGCIFNYWLKMDIWDYSDKKFNFMGQVCLMYSVLWGLLSIPVSVLCIKLEQFFDKKHIFVYGSKKVLSGKISRLQNE